MAAGKATARPKVARCRVLLDGVLLDEVLIEQADLQTQVNALDEDAPERVALVERIGALDAKLTAAETEFVFQGLGRGKRLKLAADREPLDGDDHPYMVALMSACCTEPTVVQIGDESITLDEDGWTRLHEDVLDEIDYTQLWTTCWAVNMGGVNRPERPAALPLPSERNERPKSAPPSSLESVDPS